MLYKSMGILWRLVCAMPNGLLKVRREGKTYAGGNATEYISKDAKGNLRRANSAGIFWGAPFKPVEDEK